MMDEDRHEGKDHKDEIPEEIKKKFNLPEKMGIYEINFNQIRREENSFKKLTPHWSGQDVLPMQLDHKKSLSVIDHLNSHRVWPLGIHGILKRIRFVLRIKVKSSFFDNSMTFAVLLNTITLSV